MAESLQTQIENLRQSVTGLESQRSVLGDKIVNPALAALRQQLAVLEQQVTTEAAPSEERRMVTILFVDIVGSTSMAEKLDPEEWRQIVSRVHTTLGEAITTHHGEVAQYLGDGLLAFFGSKEASEHDPENAIRAALDGQSAVTDLPGTEKIQLRAGIHTGLVVVGELGDAIHKEFTASGDAMNLAARLQSAAPPGGTLISHDTYRYVRGVFDLTPRPPLTVKGKSEPLQTYLVRRAKPRPFRSISRGVAGVETRTIGREAEMQALQAAYLRAFEGHGTVWAQLLGDPGVGKSRLLLDMNDWIDLRDETIRLLRARAFPDDLNQPFSLVRRMWFDRFQIADDTPIEQAEAKWVERFTEFYGQEDREEAAHALGLVVGLPFENSPHIKGMRNDPNQVKGRAFVVSRDLFKAVRQSNPVVVLLEDLQWMDLASWEYLMEVFLGDVVTEEPNGLFILSSARMEWRPPKELMTLFESSLSSEKTKKSWGILINLAPLTDQSSRELAMELLQRATDVPAQVVDLLVERSEGVPYYSEEMVNWFIDHDILVTHSEKWHFLPEKLKEQPLPATLQHLLLTRLSTLSQAERAALQRGAIFGRRFWTGGVEALGVSAGAEMLGHLQPRGFVEAQPESAFQGDTEWSFHQNMLQEVTYESVLKRERSALHKVAANWLEQQARQAGRLDEFAGLLGEHSERAGALSEAADWYLLAGKRAFDQGAPREALGFYNQALELLPPVDRERRWQVLLGKDDALMVQGNAELIRHNLAALVDLSRSFGDDNYLAEAYFRQAFFGITTTKEDVISFDQACQEALSAARRCGNEAIEAKSLAMIAVGNAARTDEPASLDNIAEAMKIARRLGDERVLAFVLARVSFCYSTLGDNAKFYSMQNEQLELDHRLGNRSGEAAGLNNLGSFFMTMGMYKQARSYFEQSRRINEGLGSHQGKAINLGNLGEIYQLTGDLRNAQHYLEQALQELAPTEDPWATVFTYQVLGVVFLGMGDSTVASRHFSQAREIALSRDLIGPASEASAGLAACAIMQGQLEEARKYVTEAWDYLKTHGWVALENPGAACRMCAEVYDALGDSENAQLVIQNGHQAMMDKAKTISEPDWRKSFLENVPDNRWLMEMWERRKR